MNDFNKVSEADLSTIIECPLFKNFSENALKFFIEDSVIVYLNKGDYIFKEKDSSDSMYIILDGEIKIQSFANDKEIIFASLKKYAFFGEIAMLTKQKRLTDAIASTSAKLLVLTMANFDQLQINHPELLSNVYKEMLIIVCNRLKITDQKIIIKTIYKD